MIAKTPLSHPQEVPSSGGEDAATAETSNSYCSPHRRKPRKSQTHPEGPPALNPQPQQGMVMR